MQDSESLNLHIVRIQVRVEEQLRAAPSLKDLTPTAMKKTKLLVLDEFDKIKTLFQNFGHDLKNKISKTFETLLAQASGEVKMWLDQILRELEKEIPRDQVEKYVYFAYHTFETKYRELIEITEDESGEVVDNSDVREFFRNKLSEIVGAMEKAFDEEFKSSSKFQKSRKIFGVSDAATKSTHGRIIYALKGLLVTPFLATGLIFFCVFAIFFLLFYFPFHVTAVKSKLKKAENIFLGFLKVLTYVMQAFDVGLKIKIASDAYEAYTDTSNERINNKQRAKYYARAVRELGPTYCEKNPSKDFCNKYKTQFGKINDDEDFRNFVNQVTKDKTTFDLGNLAQAYLQVN